MYLFSLHYLRSSCHLLQINANLCLKFGVNVGCSLEMSKILIKKKTKKNINNKFRATADLAVVS